jgi:hypothetical protein
VRKVRVLAFSVVEAASEQTKEDAMTNKLSVRLAIMGATTAAATAGLLAIPTGPANASVCDDGWTIFNAYCDNGYLASCWAMLNTLELNGCY